MYIILGATGHVGSAVAETLLTKGERVTVVTRDPAKSDQWKQKGAEVAVADVHDVKRLRQIFQTGKRLFLLNPPASPDTDTVAEEKKSLASIMAAVEGSDFEKIVAQSTYGAHDGEGVGDLGVLYELEQKLSESRIPFSVVRGAYYMSN
ncbi:NAD(P)H-binding protein [Dyadobacter chenwenxiniae]|uniref:NAD(P)H-binding protein n=1 Tax=Dyadobacter chenwenxiniae TaxID=2906456 RepID=A0A9X1PK68_9BACT|nr:NAD(P)H-binding protein [Dyadobacter chenwenxiniae]MCF0060261.1 NAD(P)H-binding protein [Dyadobacter chenwenxiniae]UON85999.1 NAD(P)H-binding protein [Dyadobacter chenwenxiniae]